MLINFSFSDKAVGYIVEGAMDQKAIQELKSAIIEMLEEHKTINLYLEDKNIERFTLDAVFIASIFPMQHIGRLNKVAMVTNRKWIHAIGTFNKLLIGTEIRNFTIAERLDAMSWIASD